MNQSITWETFFQEKTVEISGREFPLQLPTVQRNDGFTLVREASTREGVEIFLCEGSFKSFRFYAHRGFSAQNDVYYVQLKANNKRHWVDNPDPLEPVIKQHAHDIRAALLHFPPLPSNEHTKVKDVLFDARSPEDLKSILLNVEEL